MVFSLSPTKMWRNSPRMAGTTVLTLGSRVRCHGAGLERRVRSTQWSDRCFGLVGLLFPTADEANHSMGESHAPKALASCRGLGLLPRSPAADGVRGCSVEPGVLHRQSGGQAEPHG